MKPEDLFPEDEQYKIALAKKVNEKALLELGKIDVEAVIKWGSQLERTYSLQRKIWYQQNRKTTNTESPEKVIEQMGYNKKSSLVELEKEKEELVQRTILLNSIAKKHNLSAIIENIGKMTSDQAANCMYAYSDMLEKKIKLQKYKAN